MLAVFTAHTHTPQLPSLTSHRRPDMATSSKEKAEPLSDVSMGRVCYTQVGSWEVQIFTLCSREFVCLCAFPAACQAHFQPLPVAFSSCQLHSSCAIFTPFLHFLGPPTTMSSPQNYCVSRPLSFGKERTRTFLSRSTVQEHGWGKLPSYLRTNHPSWSSSAYILRPPQTLSFYVKLKLEQFWSFGKRKLCLV